MKKIFSLALVAVMAISVFAQVKVERTSLATTKVAKQVMAKKTIDMPTNMTVFKNGQLPAEGVIRHAKAEDASTDTAFYIATPAYALYGGMLNNGDQMWPTIFQPVGKDFTFYNVSICAAGQQFGWFVNNNQISADTNFVVEANTLEAGGAYNLPTLAYASGAEYAYGSTEDNSYWCTFDPADYYPMTKCHMYTSTAFNKYGTDCQSYSLSEDMWYMFGSGIDFTPYATNPQSSLYGMGVVDTIGTPWGFDGMSTLIDSINLSVISWDVASLQLSSNLKISLHPVTYDAASKTNLIDFDQTIASHTATANDITYSYTVTNQGATVGTLGVVTFPIKAAITGRFFIAVSGLNDANANFGIMSDGADEFGIGDTYFISNDKFLSWGYNAAISVNALIDETGTRGFDNIDAQKVKATKQIHNGQLIIKRGNKEFNVLGAQL